MELPVGEIASLGAAASWAIGLSLFRGEVRAIGAMPVNLFKGVLGMAMFALCAVALDVPLGGRQAQLMLLASGLLGLALGDTLLFVALGELGAHRAALFGSLGPVMTAIGGWALLDERLTPWESAGIVLASAGVAMVVYFRGSHAEDGRPSKRGVACGIASALCQAGGVLLSKEAMTEVHFLGAAGMRLFAANLALIGVLAYRRRLGSAVRLMFEGRRPLRMARATFFATFLGLGLMQLGIAETESAVANALHSTTPLFTLPIGIFVLRERIGALAIFGSLVAVGGVFLLLLAGTS